MEPAVGLEMCSLCDWALQKLGVLTSELDFDECTYLDLLLLVCLSLYYLLSMMTQAETG